ncbi:MAG: NapC/NirT family cytochrome c [Actinobacteria bacterium]|nr:NapC/NirT family cytochrome c [Actinomycetota bacterium]
MAKNARRWWSPWWAKGLVVVAVLGILFIGGSAFAAQFTESNKFCGTDCHEMWPERDTWQKSAHKNVDCVQCHIPPGPVSFVKTKLSASREVWVHFTGVSKKPITATRHVSNATCQRSGCHTGAQTSKTLKLGAPSPVTFKHDSEGHAKQLCVDCHAALVHAGAPGVTAPPANSMASCFSCHNDGPKNCSYCHEPPHVDRGPCRDCHNISSWGQGKSGAHPGGPLTGKHAQTACETCHTQGTNVKPDGCITCHGDQHNGLPNCVDCHKIAGWTPTTFVHPQEGPHVPAGDEPLQCDSCHQGGFGQKPGCPCHGGNPPTGD